ncbi:MAG TPA: flagellar basal-body MS-ring/collar protein FliF [Acidimicrobiia bacterium]|jgi:flagellar M-ring protein FliF
MPLVDVDRLKQGGQKFVSGFTPGQKVMSVLGVAGLVVAMFMFSKWGTKPSYAPLFSNLSAQDAGSITNALSGMNVPYQLADGGGTVLVPQSNLYKARIDLASKGLPANSDGFALLDKAGITTSDFTQHVDYQRAVQTELANTIEAINGVQGATVNLALPTQDPFVGDSQQNATAAVQVDTGGVQMPQDNVQAIVHLVSASVENLSSSNITVSDTMGHLLYSGGQDSSFTSGQNMTETQSYEDGVRQEVTQQLNSVLGPGHAAVAVNATLDFTQGTRQTTTNTPVTNKKGAPVPGTTSKDDTKLTQPAGSSGTGGILGSNTTGTGAANNGTATSTSGGTENYSENNDQTQNIVDQITSKTTNPPFSVTALSVSVGLDQAKVSAAQLPTLRNLIAAATGINPSVANGADQLVVARTAMNAQEQKLAQQSLSSQTNPKKAATPLDLMGVIRYVVTLLIVLLVLVFAWRSVKKAHAAMGTVRMPLDLVALESGAAGAALVNEYAGGLPAGAVGAIGAGGLAPAEPREIAPAPTSVEMEVGELIERQPEEVAQTLRSWLAERRS